MTDPRFASFELLPVPIYVCGLDRKLRFANSAMREAFGCSSAGSSCHVTIFGRASVCPWCGSFAGVSPVAGVWEFEEIRTRHFYRATSILSGDSDDPVLITTLLNISNEKLLVHRLRRAERLEAIGQLASGIVHDFKNVLSAISGFAEMAWASNIKDDGTVIDTLLARRLVSIRDASTRANSLVERLQFFSRYGLANRVEINLGELISETIGFLEHAIDKRIRLVRDLSSIDAVIEGDPQQIHTALLNVLVNSRDSMPDGGTVCFTVCESSLSPADIARYLPDSEDVSRFVEIRISDTGPGIEPAEIERLYDPMHSPRVGRGSGPGFATVIRIMKEHGGHFTVDSTPGTGSTFHLYLPAQLKRSAGTTAAQPLEVANAASVGDMPLVTTSGERFHVLVVDDEEMIRHIVEEMLSRQDFCVTTCANGREAVSFFRREHATIDLVLLDMLMPEVNGSECFEELKRIDPQVSVLIMTGDARQSEVERLHRNGIVGLVHKPFHGDEIVEAVRTALLSRESGRR